MIRITSLFIVYFFGFQQHGTYAGDLGTFSSCFTDHMVVEVDLTQNTFLVPDEIHLNDVNCKKTDSNATFVRFEIPLSGCGTIRDGSDPDFLFFSNSVRWEEAQQPGQLQTRLPRFESRITCRYPRNGTVSTSIRPVEGLTVSQTVYGQFSFSFEIFRESIRTKETKRDLGISVIPNTPLYFRARVISPDSDLVLHLSRCWARNEELDGPPAFIEKGCNTGNDATLVYQCNANSATQDFHLNAFRILNSPNDKVFFLCDVIVCLKTANSSICKDRCDNCTNPSGGRRRRAAEEDKDIGHDPGSKIYSLSIGPFSVKEGDGKDQKNQQEGEETDVKGTQLTLAMIVVLCVTSLIAVGLICATIIIVITYKRWSAKHKEDVVDGNIPTTKPRKPKVLKL